MIDQHQAASTTRQISCRTATATEMSKRVARFAELKGASDGLPDMAHPEGLRTLINVIGFAAPDADKNVHSPVGSAASAAAAIPINEGFNLGFARAKPGCGAFAHVHDTNETFMPLTGQWRFFFNEGEEQGHVDLGPYDVISMPPGVARGFTNITQGDPEAESLLLYVIAGVQPQVEYTALAEERFQPYLTVKQ
ncbi:MAG TPA: cupin domain-containing protein [Eoetvoesiella sp.]